MKGKISFETSFAQVLDFDERRPIFCQEGKTAGNREQAKRDRTEPKDKLCEMKRVDNGLRFSELHSVECDTQDCGPAAEKGMTQIR